VVLVGKFSVVKCLVSGFPKTNFPLLLNLHHTGVVDDHLDHAKSQRVHLRTHGFNLTFMRTSLLRLFQLFRRFHSSYFPIATPD